MIINEYKIFFFVYLTPPLRNGITSRKYMSVQKNKQTNKHIYVVFIEHSRVFSCTHDNLDRYRGYKQIQVILIFQLLFTGSFVFITSHSSVKISALFVTIQASQIKSNQITSNHKKKKKKKKKISNIMSDSHLFVYLFINLF